MLIAIPDIKFYFWQPDDVRWLDRMLSIGWL